jgi:F-type H+-transporting ATPase subunit delta
VRSAAISRNYAETLLALAKRHGGDPTIDDFGDSLSEFTALLEREPRIRAFLETPLVNAERKKKALQATLAGRVPELFLRFLLVVIDKRRAPYLRDIAAQYQELVDQMRGRIRADVVLAREPDDQLRREIRDSLQRILRVEVIPSYRVEEALIGGVVIRVGGQIFDGSLRSRAAQLRRRLLARSLSGGNGR